MNGSRTLLVSAISVAALCSSLAPGDKLAYQPASGTKVTRSFTNKNSMTLDDMQTVVNGQTQPGMEVDMEMSFETNFEVSDEFTTVVGGRPTDLKRTFDKLEAGGHFAMDIPMMPAQNQDKSIDAASELEGKTVRFVWNEESSEYELKFHETEGDVELLKALKIDMDFAGLAPGAEQSAGDTWKIDVETLRGLLAPGGDLAIRPTDDGEMSGQMPGMDSMGDTTTMLGDEIEGEATAEYLGLQDHDGGRYAAIKLKLDIKSSTDLTEKVSKDSQDLPEGMGQFEIDHVDQSFEMQAEGTAYWDVAANMLHSVQLSGNVKVEMDTAMKIDVAGRKMDLETSMKMSGTLELTQKVTKN